MTMSAADCRKTKWACYVSSLSMASALCLPPLLFATFREMYGMSYTFLGTLVVLHFCTQLSVDLIFSFFSRYFNIHRTFRCMPLITTAGLCVYALVPLLFPQYARMGLIAGTVIFSVAAGLLEVLASPVVAALPSDTPEKDMSALHSLYGYGVVGVVLISTLYLQWVGHEYWMYLALFWAVLPVGSWVLLTRAVLPEMQTEQKKNHVSASPFRTKGLMLCTACIFLGACAELTMSNWISLYTEKVLHIPKLWGDLLGMSLLAVLLALTRTAYAKYGRNIYRTLVLSMLGSAVCYAAASLLASPALSLMACALLGVCTAMLWPGTLILMEEKIPMPGVAAYALMAAGGDFGASVAPQALGMIVDRIALTEWAQTFGSGLSLTPEEVGFKAGMLMAAAFPALGVLLLMYMKRFFRKQA